MRPFLTTFIAMLVNAACLADFSISYSVDGVSELSSLQNTLLSEALDTSQQLVEGIITGHQGQAALNFDVVVTLTTTGLASARPGNTVRHGGFTYPTSGQIWLNKNQIVPATDGLGIADGVDILAELMAHETAHALGFGTLWRHNGLYSPGSGKYLGQHGLAAYQSEFDPSATWVPVELAGPGQSANSHWDQVFRSSASEGNPQAPLSLSPLTGITDAAGRDLGLEIMTAALDPDFGEPFLSQTTIQSFRDLGYHVVPEPAPWPVAFAVTLCLAARRRKRQSDITQSQFPHDRERRYRSHRPNLVRTGRAER